MSWFHFMAYVFHNLFYVPRKINVKISFILNMVVIISKQSGNKYSIRLR